MTIAAIKSLKKGRNLEPQFLMAETKNARAHTTLS